MSPIMSPTRPGSYESDALAERDAQRVLNEKVGERLPERPSWSRRLKWHSRTDGSRSKDRTQA
jgi:hypothetical protein